MNNILYGIILVGIWVATFMLVGKIHNFAKSVTNVEGYRIFQYAYGLVLGSLALVFAYYSTYTYFYSIIAGLCFASVLFAHFSNRRLDREGVELYCEFQKLLSKLDDSGFQHTQKAYELRGIMGKLMSELPKKYQEEIIEREKELDKEDKV